MSLSSFCVCMNALRLNLVKLGGGKSAEKTNEGTKAEVKTAPNVEIELKTAEGEQAEKKTSDRAKENDKMTKTIYITGMMCGHCEATVKKALEALSGVDAAEVSHEAGTAVVTLSADISDEVLTKAVTDKDYEVTDIK